MNIVNLAKRYALLACAAVMLCIPNASAQVLVNVADTLKNADGSNASGRIEISWTQFTTGAGVTIDQGSLVYTVTNGVINISLTPNVGATPTGTSYTARFFLAVPAGCTTCRTGYTETWVVPGSGPVTISAIRTSTAPVPIPTVNISQVVGGTGNRCARFDSGGVLASHSADCGAGGGGITLTEVDGAPSFAPSTLRFDQADGFVLTDLGGGIGRLDLGTITVPGGGTGLTTLSANQLYVGRGTSVPVPIASGAVGSVLISQGAGIDPVFSDPFVSGIAAHDAPGASTNPVAIGAYASAAAPSDVSADTDIVRAWALRNGSLVVNLASGGTLIGGAGAPLRVDPTGTTTQPVSGTVSANAGTNLNTSALNLEATQADVRTALQIIDDWDETDRAKVNPIAGQAGVQGASGVVTALTQRVVLATDVGLPAGANNIGTVNITDGAGAVNVICDSGCAGGTQYAVDAALGSTPTGTLAIAIRDDALSTLTPVEDDAIGLRVNSVGALWTAVNGPVTVTDGAGAINVICDSGCGGAATIEDEDTFTVGTTAVNPIGYLVDETTPDSAPENSVAAPRMSLNRVAYSMLRDAAGNERGANVNASNALLVAQTGELPAGTQNIGDVGIASLPNEGQQTMANSISVVIASNQSAIPVDGSGVTQPVSNAGTFAVQAAQSGTWNVTNISGTVSLPTGASTLAEQQTQTTALQLIDDIVRAEDDASADLHKGAVILAKRDDTPGNTSGTDGDYEPLQVSGGRLWVSAAVESIAAGDNNIGNFDLASAIPAGTNNIGDVDVLTLPSVTIGTFPDNEPFNVAQINGVTPLMGNGASGTGAQRVTIANDSTGILASIGSITGSVVPGTGATNLGKAEDAASADQDTGVQLLAVRDDTLNVRSGAENDYEPLHTNAKGALFVERDVNTNTTGPFRCTNTAIYSAATNGNTELVAISGSTVVYVCSFHILSGGTVNVRLVNGTGTACATGEDSETPTYELTAQSGLVVPQPGDGIVLATAAGDALCIETSAGVSVQAMVNYTQF